MEYRDFELAICETHEVARHVLKDEPTDVLCSNTFQKGVAFATINQIFSDDLRL